MDSLKVLLSKINEEIIEVEDKLKTAEICYNSSPSIESKQVLDEIEIENLKVKYRLTMLKILDLLVKNYDDFDKFREKREKLLDLIKYRRYCLDKLNIKVSIDPFVRTKIEEQLDTFSSFKDSTKRISQIKKEIGGLTIRVEEMEAQNKEYMLFLNDKKDILINTTSMNDIDISDITLDIEDYIEDTDKVVLDNQVVSVKIIPLHFNMDIVKQKTSRVISRVNEMMNDDKKEEIFDGYTEPELVIVPQSIKEIDTKDSVVEDIRDNEGSVLDNNWFDDWSNSFNLLNDVGTENKDEFDNFKIEDSKDDNVDSLIIDKIDNKEINLDLEDDIITDNKVNFPMVDDVSLETSNANIFSTVDPFVEVPLYTDRVDENIDLVGKVDEPKIEFVDEYSSTSSSLNDNQSYFFDLEKDLVNDEVNEKVSNNLDSSLNEDNDAFWPVQEESEMEVDKDLENQEDFISFEEQIGALLANDGDIAKTRKRIA